MTATVTLIDEVDAGLDETVLKEAAGRALAGLRLNGEITLTVRLVDEVHIQPLNREYLGKDAPTDVLSFPVHDFASGKLPDTLPQGPILLGEVVVNLDQAKKQAASSGQGSSREVQSLIEHGVRHLIGYHHQDSKHG